MDDKVSEPLGQHGGLTVYPVVLGVKSNIWHCTAVRGLDPPGWTFSGVEGPAGAPVWIVEIVVLAIYTSVLVGKVVHRVVRGTEG